MPVPAWRHHQAKCGCYALSPNVLNGGTTLIHTKEPLLPSTVVANVYTLPPYDVEGTSLEDKFLRFITKGIKIDSAVVAENVCPGILCDRQNYQDACHCLETSSSKVWVLCIETQCPQLNEDVHNDDMHSIIFCKARYENWNCGQPTLTRSP